jgi:hypothetical protein
MRYSKSGFSGIGFCMCQLLLIFNALFFNERAWNKYNQLLWAGKVPADIRQELQPLPLVEETLYLSSILIQIWLLFNIFQNNLHTCMLYAEIMTGGWYCHSNPHKP